MTQPTTWLDYILTGFAFSSKRMLYELGVLGGILVVEILWQGWRASSLGGLKARSKSDQWDLVAAGLKIVGVSGFIANFMLIGSFAFVAHVTEAWSYGALNGLPFWIGLAILFLVYDLWTYWMHRIQHESDWGWITHEFHHSATRVSTLTGFRKHPLDLVFWAFTIFPIQILLGPSLEMIGILAVAQKIFGLFHHSRIDRDFGFLGRWVLVTPRFHHVHHLRSSEMMMKNYGNFLVVWDRLFGTYAEPLESLESAEQGLVDNRYERTAARAYFISTAVEFYSFPFRKAKMGLARLLNRSQSGR